MSCLQGGEQYLCIPGNAGSCLISLPPLLKVNGGKGGGGDANREKSAWIGAPSCNPCGRKWLRCLRIGSATEYVQLYAAYLACSCLAFLWLQSPDSG